MGHMLSRLAAGALTATVLVLLVPGGPAGAQYPIGGVDDCAETFEGDGGESTTFAPGDDIQMQGQAGCADPNETGIEAILESDPVLLARFNANADGSYTSPVATIPADTEPGAHDVVVRTSANQYVQPITITDEGATSGLPATGRNIAVLALWGTLTLVLGSVLIGLTWRRWQEARMTAEVEDGWAGRAYALGTLDERDATPYRPQMTEWIDPPGVIDPPEVTEEPRQAPLTAPLEEPPLEEPPLEEPPLEEPPLEEPPLEEPPLEELPPEEPPAEVRPIDREAVVEEMVGRMLRVGAEEQPPRPPRPPRELVSIPVDPPERVDRLESAGEQDGGTSRRTSTRASEIVDRLRDEIDAVWGH